MIFCNINFNQKNKADLFAGTENNRTKFIVTVNAAFIVEANKSKRFFNILNTNHVTFDGKIPYITAKICSLIQRGFHGFKIKNEFEKLAGSDIVYDFCEFAKQNNYRMFFLGGKKESNQTAVQKIKEKYNIVIAGYSPSFEEYPFSEQFNTSCLNEIKQFEPEILFVGFGAPKQEYWADDNMSFLSKIGVKYIIGCGGTFDFISGLIKRAPIFIQKIGIEIVYRFFQEPNKTRFMRLINSIKFFKYIFKKPDFM
jgi:N-acetylglucosaminyldiphosphoundecaprenol N-acetyl-beta-D-mannosaminyltransferase